ncbi:MAG: hypothetical protein LBO74_07995, partial [Candidatus Symbiothrix sp.]|jgi:hypothetical protein|nr:hypothetical protein [Candidatus Symbiothrix sp.]
MYFMLSLLLVMTTGLKAQVVIGTNAAEPVASAVLDLNSGIDGNLGLLLPRVALESATDEETIKDPATGLMVYADGTGGLAAGVYVWDGSKWVTEGTAVVPPEGCACGVGPDGYYYRIGTSCTDGWVATSWTTVMAAGATKAIFEGRSGTFGLFRTTGTVGGGEGRFALSWTNGVYLGEIGSPARNPTGWTLSPICRKPID